MFRLFIQSFFRSTLRLIYESYSFFDHALDTALPSFPFTEDPFRGFIRRSPLIFHIFRFLSFVLSSMLSFPF